MASLALFIDTTSDSLITGINAPSSVNPASLPLFFGDTLNLQVFLLNKVGTSLASSNPYTVISTAGLQLFLYLDDGTVGGTIYTQQITWNTDVNNQYFYSTLSLNTESLQTLLGESTNATAWLKVGYIQGGLQTTVLSALVNIGVGIPVSALVVPPGLVALSTAAAQATYFPLQPVPGMTIYIMSPLGKILALQAVDANGTAQFQVSNVN